MIKYNKPETLKIIKSLAKYLDFKVLSDEGGGKSSIDDIFIPADKTLSISELEGLFAGKGVEFKKLREQVWKRTK
jgi:hypothetical protein